MYELVSEQILLCKCAFQLDLDVLLSSWSQMSETEFELRENSKEKSRTLQVSLYTI